MAGVKRYADPKELLAAVEAWARGILPAYYSSKQGVAALRAATAKIAGTDGKLEARAKKLWESTIDSLREVAVFAEQNPRTNSGYAYAVRHLKDVLVPRGFDTLRATVHHLEQFPRNLDTRPSRGWTPMTHLVFEVGNPWPAPERKEGWRLGIGGRWRFHDDHELSLDELVAFAILAGLYTEHEALQTITQARRQKAKGSAAGATVADGRDYVRKAARERIKFLTAARAQY